MKKTACAFSNIAFIKYWGVTNSALRIPFNNSISMNLSNLKTITTVEFSPQREDDEIIIDGQENQKVNKRIVDHLNRIRVLSKSSYFAKVVSQNNFPASSGLSSSASGFAALTLAATAAINLNLTEKELSIQARIGSGSASRSIPGGFVQWQKGDSSDNSYAYTLFPQSYWSIVDVVAIISDRTKTISTTEAQSNVLTSPFIEERLKRIEDKITNLKKAISERNFIKFGEIIESECLEFHSIVMTQTPALIYLFPQTLALMHLTRELRFQGLQVYFTLNTGHNVHLICQEKDKDKLVDKLSKLDFIKKTIINFPAGKATLLSDHLF